MSSYIDGKYSILRSHPCSLIPPPMQQLVRTTSTKPEPQTPPPQATIALFTFFNPHNGRVHHSKFSPHSSQTKKQKEAISDTPLLHSLFDQCLDRNLPLLAIPIDFTRANSSGDRGTSTPKSAESELLRGAMQKALKTVPGKVRLTRVQPLYV